MTFSAEAWFAAQDWQPFPFQQEVWSAMAGGCSGLLEIDLTPLSSVSSYSKPSWPEKRRADERAGGASGRSTCEPALLGDEAPPSQANVPVNVLKDHRSLRKPS